MSLPHSTSLKNSSNLTLYINDMTKKILLNISSKINQANKNRINKIDVMIPTFFDYGNTTEISNECLQLIIYNKLISELEKNSYKLLLDIKKDFAVFSISWGVDTEYDYSKLLSKINSLKK